MCRPDRLLFHPNWYRFKRGGHFVCKKLEERRGNMNIISYKFANTLHIVSNMPGLHHVHDVIHNSYTESSSISLTSGVHNLNFDVCTKLWIVIRVLITSAALSSTVVLRDLFRVHSLRGTQTRPRRPNDTCVLAWL